MSRDYDETYPKIRRKITEAFQLLQEVNTYPETDKAINELFVLGETLLCFSNEIMDKIEKLMKFKQTIDEFESKKEVKE